MSDVYSIFLEGFVVSKIYLAVIIFMLVEFAITFLKSNLIAAVLANIPFFTFFAFLNTKQNLLKMSLYLFSMTLCISLSYLLVYIFGSTNKQTAVSIFLCSWFILTSITYIILRRFAL